MLASQISQKYSGQDCAVVALSDGGAMVGAQIAVQMHAVMCMLLADQIQLPREIVAIAGISQDGSFTYNRAYSAGEIDEIVSEYRGLIEQQKLEKLHEMHRSMGKGGLIRKDLIEHRHVILTSDGLASGFAIDLAMEDLKPIPVKSLIIAVPFASVRAVDRMHILADDIFCMNVLEDYISTEHYYDSQDVPEHDVVLRTVERIIRDWQKPPKK